MSDTRTPTPPARPAPSRLDRLMRRARWSLRVERVVPPLVLAAGLLAVFVAVSWLGLWVRVPWEARLAGVILFGLALAVALGLGARGWRVADKDALARLDRDSGQPHRPVSASTDRLANPGSDPMTQALWDLSRRRLDATLARLRLRRPSPDLPAHDPFALRAAAVLVLVAAGFVAGEHKDGLVAAAFDWRRAPGVGAGFRVDAWVDPPGYTGKPPVVLLAGTGANAPQTLAVPVHSVVVVRGAGAGQLGIETKGGLRPLEPAASTAVNAAPSAGSSAPDAHAPGSAAAAGEHRFALDGNGHLTLSHDGSPVGTVDLSVIPDAPPTIALVGEPRATARGGLTVGYTIADDYGVTGAEAAFADPVDGDRPAVRSLVPPPRLALNLPPTPGGLGNGQTTGDLSDHPWAGTTVTVTLSTKDEGGNVGLSAPLRFTLPARPFTKPLARALVEQRRLLVLDPDHREGVATALDALTIDPDAFGITKAVYLGLYTARQRLAGARNDTDLLALSDYLWSMALRIEEGDKSAAARDLQAAEQALRDALQRGASPDEIKRLTEALKAQMDRMLSEMAQNAEPSRPGEAPDPSARTVTPDQLKAMMDRMQQLAQNGNTAEAQRLLDQLQSMMDNLRQARRGSQNSQARREMNRQMGELDKMTRDQQALRDRTFKQGQGASPDDDDEEAGGAPQPPSAQGQQDGDQAGQDLQGQQQSLRERLDALQKRMRQLGMQGEKGLDDANKAMEEAQSALGQGQNGRKRAVDAQGRALQGLQQGANGLAQQMAQQGQGQGEGQGEADGQGNGGSSISQGNPGQDGTDPLGRRRDGRGTVETEGRALEDSVAERAQRVLQELRRRLGDPGRPTAEKDYLERLLTPY